MPEGNDDGDGASYSFVPGEGETVGRLLDAAAESMSRLSSGWSAVKRAAIAIGIPEDAGVVEEAALAMGYQLRMGLGTEAAGCRLAPTTPAGEHSWPPPIANVSVDTVRLWSEAAGHVTHPAAVARLEDLLFERRDRNAMVHATAAITAYLDVASIAQSPLDKTEALMRAWDLATRVDARDLHATCRQRIVARAQLIVDSGEHLPGLLFPLLKALARGPLAVKGTAAVSDPIDVDLLLQTAMGLYPEGYLVSQVADMVRSRHPDPEVLDVVNRQEVDAYLAEAKAGPALLRQTRLTDAIEVARRRGLREVAERATASCKPSTSLNSDCDGSLLRARFRVARSKNGSWVLPDRRIGETAFTTFWERSLPRAYWRHSVRGKGSCARRRFFDE